MDLTMIGQWLAHGLWDLPWYGIVAFALVTTHVTIVSVTLYLHRHSAHRALELHPVLKHFFRFWLWLATAMNTREWTAIHRKHHAVCETDDDPHSPQVQGIRKIFWQGTEAYRAAATPETLERYGAGTPNDWIERNVYSRYQIGGVALLLVIDLALFGIVGLSVWGVQMLWIPVTAAGVINGIGHYWGYRNFECPDAARNVVPWGILIGGEELHNNHHTYPNSAKLSVRKWEFDVGWMWIKLFQWLRLAKPLSTGPVAQRVDGKSHIDMDTVWGALNDRFRVMALYRDTVVKPLVAEEYHKADSATRALLDRAKRMIWRDDSLVNDAQRERLDALVQANDRIAVVYELKLRLQQVWAKRGGSAEELLADFRSWCAAAEASGIQALKDFADELKRYTVAGKLAPSG